MKIFVEINHVPFPEGFIQRYEEQGDAVTVFLLRYDFQDLYSYNGFLTEC